MEKLDSPNMALLTHNPISSRTIGIFFSFLCLITFDHVFGSLSYASEMYRYVDKDGTVSYTDDVSRVPKGKIHKSKKRDDREGSLPNASELGFTLVNNHIIVPVTLKYNGREVSTDFVFDTGASLTVISPSTAERLNINLQDTEVSLMQGVGGTVVTGNILLDMVASGPIRWSNMSVGIVPLGNIDGLLGMDFLSGKRFQVDYHARVIRWQ